MLIGDKYADNKMYRGIEHYDTMPLTSNDIHESSDTDYMKNAYTMNNLLGYGTMNIPNIVKITGGLRLSDPSVVMIDGDIALIQSDDNKVFVSTQDVKSAGNSEGFVCILGWYQHISVSSVLRNYGGVDNSEIPNDLKDDRFSTAISSRYQLRWFPVIISKTDESSDSITITITDRDKDGTKLSTTSTLTSKGKKNKVFLFDKPDSMDYAVSDLYLVPLFSYKYSGNSIREYIAVDKLRAGDQFTVSEDEPTGNLSDGARWYNPVTREFKTYVNGAFVDSSASKMAFLQYQSIHVVEEAKITPQDIVVPIGVDSFQEGDILRVIYEGLELAKDLNYTIDYTNKTVKLLDFTTNVGDVIYFTVTRVVEASDITNVTELFLRHIETSGSSTVSAHVNLTDTIGNSDATQGVAATPKLVNTAKSELTTQITQAKTELNGNIAQAKTELQTEMNTLQVNTSSAVSNLSDKVTAMQTEVNSMKPRVSTLETDVTALKSEVQSIEGNLNRITDDTTGITYKIGINNGVIYLEEV